MADGRARIIIALELPDAERLAAWAKAEERAPDQQATWIIRTALRHVTEVAEVKQSRPRLPAARVA